MVEVERLEVTYDAGRGEIVERDAAYPTIPGAPRMRRTMPSDVFNALSNSEQMHGEHSLSTNVTLLSVVRWQH